MTSCSILGGAGALGNALAYKLAKAGHNVCIGSRQLDKALDAAQALKDRLPDGAHVEGAELQDAAARSEVVFLTVPYAAQTDTLHLVKSQLEGKILVDATVPLRPPKVGTVQLPDAGAAALEAQAVLGDGVRIVTALQTIGAEKLNGDEVIDCDVLAASNDSDAVETVSQLLADVGLRTWHVGPLANAAAAEALTSILIQINRRYKIAQAGIRITGRPKDAPASRDVSVHPVDGLPLLQPNDNLADLVLKSLEQKRFTLRDGDVLVIAQKAVSKVENRFVKLDDVEVSDESRAIARDADKQPEVVELIQRESEEIMRVRAGVVIARHRTGVVAANAGIDSSNVAAPEENLVLLWPEDPDASAQRLRKAIQESAGASIAVIISDSLGRAWRVGTAGAAIGVAGMKPVRDMCGDTDLYGRKLEATNIAVADEIAAAASLVLGEAAEGVAAAVVRGASFDPCEDSGMQALLRSRSEDLFP